MIANDEQGSTPGVPLKTAAPVHRYRQDNWTPFVIIVGLVLCLLAGVYLGVTFPKPAVHDVRTLPLSLLSVKAYNLDGSWDSQERTHLSVDKNGVTHGVASLVHKGETITVYVELLPELKAVQK